MHNLVENRQERQLLIEADLKQKNFCSWPIIIMDYLQKMAAACSGGIALRLDGQCQPGSDIRSTKYKSSVSGVLNVLLVCLQNSLEGRENNRY